MPILILMQSHTDRIESDAMLITVEFFYNIPSIKGLILMQYKSKHQTLNLSCRPNSRNLLCFTRSETLVYMPSITTVHRPGL